MARGARALGIPVQVRRRNVKYCWNLGYCGMGCPTNAKQSALVALLPMVLDRGGRLLSRVRVDRLRIVGGRVEGVEAQAIGPSGHADAGRRISVRARHVVLAAGNKNFGACDAV